MGDKNVLTRLWKWMLILSAFLFFAGSFTVGIFVVFPGTFGPEEGGIFIRGLWDVGGVQFGKYEYLLFKSLYLLSVFMFLGGIVLLIITEFLKLPPGQRFRM